MVKLVKPHFLMVKTLFFSGNPLGHLLQGISASFGSGSRGASVGGGGKNRGFTYDCLVFFSCFLLCKWWFYMVLLCFTYLKIRFFSWFSILLHPFHVTNGGFTYSNPPFWTASGEMTTATWHPGGKGADQMGASLELRAFGEFLGGRGDGRKTWRNSPKKIL